MKLMRVIFLLAFLVVPGFMWAASSRVKPPACDYKNIVGKKGFYFLQTNMPNQLFLFYNRDKQAVWLDHPVSHPSASAGWASKLQPGKWSALLVSDPRFQVSCNYMNKKGQYRRMTCDKAIIVCHMRQIKMKNQDKNNGNFWAGENRSLTELITYLKQRDIDIRTP